jgi:hypothetical protein
VTRKSELEETVSNGFLAGQSDQQNRWKWFKKFLVELDHRPKAAVLMRECRVLPFREKGIRFRFSVTFCAPQ